MMDSEMDTSDNNIPCCLCGTLIKSNPANMCLNCLKTQVDITEGIPKQQQIFWCRGCGRYQRNTGWIFAELESRELLTLLLKKIKNLNKIVKLKDATFQWTEPHSRRLKVKLTIQKEVFNFALLQQTFVVEYVVQNLQCPECCRSYTDHVWKANCQVRQKVKHKRTFFYLEQLLLKHNICEKVMGLKEQSDGLDFYWDSKAAAQRQLDFLQSVVPTRCKSSKRLISQDDNSNTKNYKFTLYCEIAPICKDDLVCLSPQIASSFGGVSPIMLCYKVTQTIHCVDPASLKLIEIPAPLYWRYPFQPVMTATQLIEFIIIDIEHAESEATRSGRQVEPLDRNPSAIQNKQTKFNEKLGLAEVTLARESDLGVNDATIRCLTHLGNFLNAGDHVLGYDVGNANLTEVKGKQKQSLPEVVIVKKYYPKKNRAKKRQWKLKTLKKEPVDKQKKGDLEKDSEDMEHFMRDLEEDPEMRSKVNLYKKDSRKIPNSDTKISSDKKEEKKGGPASKSKLKKKSKSKGKKVKGGKKDKESQKQESKEGGSEEEDQEAEEGEEDAPQVPSEELIDELAEAMGTMSTDQSTSGLKTVRPSAGDQETSIDFGS